LTKVRVSRALCVALLFAWPLCYAQSLPELIDGVLAVHPSLRAQRALAESANQSVAAAQWQFYPTPSIEVEQVDASRADPSYPSYGDKNVTTVRLQQPLWTGGRLTAGLNKAQAGVLVSQASLEGVRQDLALRVLQFYADWYGALLKRQAYEKSLKAHWALQEQINRRIAGGISPQSDLTLLLGRTQQTKADLAAALAQEQTALGRLSQLLGRPLQPQALGAQVSAPQALQAAGIEELLQAAQEQSPSVVKLQAQAHIAQAEVRAAQADLLPEAYLRLERQYGNFAYPNSQPLNRYFVGFSSHFGAGLSSLTQVSGAQARYSAALADIDSTRLSLGEQIQADYAQAEAGQQRLLALQASLGSADNITKAWSRQFIAGRKTWSDVMNAVREAAQLETQIADAKSAQLLVTWRLAIVGHGLDTALLSGQAMDHMDPIAQGAAAEADAEALALADAAVAEAPTRQEGIATAAHIPLYPQTAADAIELRMAAQLDPSNLGVGVGGADSADLRNSPNLSPLNEGLW